MSRRPLALFLGFFAAALLALPGCQQVSVEKALTLEPGDILQPAIVDGPRSQQKIRVEVTATEPIDVDVTLESDASEVIKGLRVSKRPEGKLLATKQGVKSDAVEATIPAGKSYTVIVSGAKKKSEVKLKVNSL
jgi:hypothetical protein